MIGQRGGERREPRGQFLTRFRHRRRQRSPSQRLELGDERSSVRRDGDFECLTIAQGDHHARVRGRVRAEAHSG